jgi:CDP-L-myo-inositol myo-inositolphosphotransferase
MQRTQKARATAEATKGEQNGSGPPRVGVILAAGRSDRMRRATGGSSKALVRLGGLALVERTIRTLLSAGLERVVVVVGHQAGPVAAVAHRAAPGRVHVAYAEDWERGNGASLAAAEVEVPAGELFLLATVDHIFAEGALHALVHAGGPAVLVDHQPNEAAWGEGTRVRLREERAVAFSKELGDPSIDCGAFLLPTSVFQAQRTASERDDDSLAGAVTELAEQVPLAVVPVQEAWWLDIDTPEDLARARRAVRRSLTKDDDGPVSRYLNRPISTRLSMLIAPLRPNPDVLSWLVLGVGLVAAALLGAGRALAGAALTQIASILDGVDGEIARLQLRASAGGALLDGVLDRVCDAAVLGGLALWALRDGEPQTATVVLSIAATGGAMLSMAVKDRIRALGLPAAPERALAYLLGGRDGRLLLIALAALIGKPLVALAAVAATSAIALMLRVSLVRSWVSRAARSERP